VLTAAEYDRAPRFVESEEPGLAASLHEIWEREPGPIGWLSTVDHKEIGLRYIVTAFAFLLIGGVEALIMRVQLAQPDAQVLTPEQYNELFSLHGVTMMFLYALPVLSGFSNYLFPLVLGARDMAFPRLNAFSYWVYLASGLFMYASLLVAAAPNDGWFNYVPYALRRFNPGMNMDFYALGMIFLGVSTTVGAANFVVTFLRMRAPGMSIDRVPILTWGTMTISVGNLLAVPAVSLAFFLLWLDRRFGTHFYRPETGGQPLLWQHLFWMFAHPWVYVVVLPAMGLVSDALPFFCRRPLVGYTAVVLGTITPMILGFGGWLHHMFATGIPFLALVFFSGASFIITIPSAVAVFAWVATIWTGKPVINCAFLYFAGFICMFVIGGVSGVMTAAVAADLQLTDTYFVVAHLHYVLIGINVMAVLGALHVWMPKMSGRMLDERRGKWAFWIIFIGFNIGFLPMHLTGLMGMPRRIYTYPEGVGWTGLNFITTSGAFILAVGFLVYLLNVIASLRSGEQAGSNPWDGPSLEWSTSSPPPPYNFEVVPTVASRHPLWEDRLGAASARSSILRGPALDHGKEALATSAVEARPEAILAMPEDSLAPFIVTLAMSVAFSGLLTEIWWLAAVGLAATALGILIWLWPEPHLAQTAEARP
jgi:cytochrome c oxidase subunit I